MFRVIHHAEDVHVVDLDLHDLRELLSEPLRPGALLLLPLPVPGADEVLVRDADDPHGTGIDDSIVGNFLDNNGDVCWNVRLSVFSIIDFELKEVSSFSDSMLHGNHP